MGKVNLGFIGLGNIALTAIESLKHTNAEFEMIAGHDVDPSKQENLPKDALFYQDLDDFLKNKDIDSVYISTYNEHHYPMAKLCLEADKNVILEKPATKNITELADLARISRSKGKTLFVGFHAAYGLEIMEFLKLYKKESELQNALGEITGFRSEFFDPYVMDGRSVKRRGEHDGSWIDSGINALSVIGAIPQIKGLNFSKLNLTKIPNTEYKNARNLEINGIGHYTFTTEKGNKGHGTIETNWALGINSKKTTLYFPEHEILLDHSNEEIKLDNKSILYKNDNGLTRLVNHYIGLFEDYHIHRTENKDNLEHAHHLQKLHEGKK